MAINPVAGPTATFPIPEIVVAKPTRRLRVLMADDDFNIHLLAEAALSKDYDLVTAQDGEECLAIHTLGHPRSPRPRPEHA